MIGQPREVWDQSLVDMFRGQVEKCPDRDLFAFLDDGEDLSASWTFSDLDREARKVAAGLQAAGAGGARVLILMPPGLEYAAALFGCFFAGAVPVPVYPPDPNRLEKSLPRLVAVAQDAQTQYAITPSWLEPLTEQLESSLGRMQWLYPDRIPVVAGEDWSPPRLSARDLAFIQYTSGSTRRPRGVMLTHENLLHNVASMKILNLTPGMTGVSWLPPYHDMGLISGIIAPTMWELRAVLMSPISFLQRPARWLQAMSNFRAYLTGAPNFAFDLCTRKLTDQEKEELDLSEWGAVVNGAEPIRPRTIERFSATFAPCGYRQEAMVLAYGLAEATLMVTSRRFDRSTSYASTDGSRLVDAADRAGPDDGGQDSRLVPCGRPIGDFVVEIVDPSEHTRCAPGEVGEIWLAGRSVASGYWGDQRESSETFQGRLRDEPDTAFLRTGDLGGILDGELFIAGRHRDLLVIRGQNHFPQDIELTVERLGPPVRPGCGAAVGIELADQERLALIHEIAGADGTDLDGLMQSIRAAVRDEHALNTDAVMLLAPRTIPKTSSGKIQRHACKAGWLEGTLEPIAQWRSPALERARPGEPAHQR